MLSIKRAEKEKARKVYLLVEMCWGVLYAQFDASID
jgi:hypothetical protein